MEYEHEYASLHACLREFLSPGERGIVTWHGIGARGDTDIWYHNGQIEYMTGNYKKLKRIARSMRFVSLIIRVFDESRRHGTVPVKRLYSCVWMDAERVLKLSAQDCVSMNAIDGAPEEGVLYM